MSTQYACTYFSKEAEEDQFEHGCVGGRHGVMAEACNIASATLPGLLKALGDHYGLDLDDVWPPGEDGTEGRMAYNRLETDDGDVPDTSEMMAWKRGELRLWLADYDFTIEKRQVSPIPRAEFDAAGIKYHC